MQSTGIPESTSPSQAKSHRSLCMPRPRTKGIKEYRPLASDSEALWALIAAVAMAVAMEVYQWL